MRDLTRALSLLLITLLFGSVRPAAAGPQAELETVIIRGVAASGPLRQIVEAGGGNVVREYRSLDAVAAEVSPEALAAIRAWVGDDAILRDTLVASPEPVRLRAGRDAVIADTGSPLDNIPHLGAHPILDVPAFAARHPQAYRINHAVDNVGWLHARGITGGDAVIAVLDSGLRPDFGAYDPARIVGCDSLVEDARGCLHPDNDGHGAMVASVMLGAAAYAFEPFQAPGAGSVFLESVHRHAGAALDLDEDGTPESVALLGSAPGARIYMFRVFADRFTPTRTSVILDAVDRIIEKKKAGVNIQAANFSLGRFTLNAGRGVLDLAHDALLEAGIVPVASAGNAGPALLTLASPASSTSSVAVGAGSQAHQERIAADVGLFQAPGLGQHLRVFPAGQTAWFSSRGPTADGRMGPDVLSEGLGVYGSGLGATPAMVSLGHGTSFAAPNVAGIAVLLHESFPERSAREIHAAIVQSGNPAAVGDGSTPADQGAGWVDAARAWEILAAGDAVGTPPEAEDAAADQEAAPPATGSDPAPADSGAAALAWVSLDAGRTPGPPSVAPPPPFPQPTSVVAFNLRQATGQDIHFGYAQETLAGLRPGERKDLAYLVTPYHERIQVSISDVSIDLAACTPNPVFGDELRVALHTPKTSAIGTAGEYYDINPSPLSAHAFIRPEDLDDPAAAGVIPGACGAGACTFVLPTPEPGVARISVSGATENGCAMSARVAIAPAFSMPDWRASASGRVLEDAPIDLVFEVPPGAAQLAFELAWENDWSRYPSNDLDLQVFLPVQFFPFAIPLPFGQTLNAPERFVLTPETLGALFGSETPIPLPAGSWTARIAGFQVNERRDWWDLSIRADDQLLRARPPARIGPRRTR